eukprot:PhM_4_TR5314/c0_g1_i1/m.81897
MNRRFSSSLLLLLLIIVALAGTAQAALSVTPGNSTQQGAALQTFFTQCNGAAWANASGWSSANTNMCAAFGITCDGTLNVVSLTLSSNNIKCDGNALGTLVAALPNLSVIDVSLNNFTGAIPKQALFRVGMRSVMLKGAGFVDTLAADTFAAATDLENVDLSLLSLTGTLPTVWPSSKLTVVQLSNNKLVGTFPEALCTAAPTTLTLVDVSYNSLNGLLPVCLSTGSFPKLDSFFINGNAIEGAFPSVKQWNKDAVTMDVSDNLLSGTIPDAFPSTLQLSLVASNNQLRGALPKSLCTVEMLDVLVLDNNPLNTTLLPCLGDTTVKGKISMSNCELRGAIPDSYGAAFCSGSSVVKVDLQQNNFDCPLPKWVDDSMCFVHFKVTPCTKMGTSKK